ncbi:lactonase family protein [Limisphaera sp. 4302-co]|uniref:lactonase family protein n=1 Tax=Limisphaera sp. 4302-co TaxID=3400417 RepID=UPI003C1BF2D5
MYVSNRGHDSIAMFRVDPESGRIGLLGQENTRRRRPRHFALDPDGRWCSVAHQDSDTVVVFRVDARTGRLLYRGHSIRVSSPVCAVFARGNDR